MTARFADKEESEEMSLKREEWSQRVKNIPEILD
jgi:hypothetical protein